MLVYSVIGILLGYALSATSDITSPGSLTDLIKLFQNFNFNRDVQNGHNTLVETPTIPKSILLPEIHNLAPDILSRAADNHIPPQSKKNDDVDASIDNENRRFLDWLKKVLGWYDDSANGYNKGSSHGTTKAGHIEEGLATAKILANTKLRNRYKANDKVDDMPESRRVMDWFKTLFGSSTTDSPTTVKMNVEHVELTARKQSDQANLTMVLTQLNKVLEQLNENVYIQNLRANLTEGYLLLKLAFGSTPSRGLYRQKRATNMTSSVVEDERHSNDTFNTHNKTRLLTSRNNYGDTFVGIPPNNEKFHANHEHISAKSSSQEFKNKLVNHLTGAFKEIKQKLLPLNKMKQVYSSDDSYLIGYILANIDILEVNMDKLIAELELRKFAWDEIKLLELFDKLKACSDVIGNLIRTLKKIDKTNNKFVPPTN